MQKDANWQPDLKVITALREHIEQHGFTRAEIGSKLGFTETRIIKYLAIERGQPVQKDTHDVETAARQYLRHINRQKHSREQLFENYVSSGVAATLRSIRRTGDMGLIYGNAGLGKTKGGELYRCANANTLYIVAKTYACGARAIEEMLCKEYEDSSDEKWPHNIRRAVWLEQQLRGAERLIIVDDAEVLDISALRFLFSFHDATGIGIALIGNPEVLETLRRRDASGKLISRVGIVHQVKPGKDTEDTARKLIERHAPEATELLDEVTDVVGSFGHCRRARKQLQLARDIREGDKSISWPEAFTAAGTKLVDKEGGSK